jgi:hypothetical protein
MKYSFRKFENFHIVLWLIKDFCWIADQKIAGLIMIFPTIFMAIYITYMSRTYPTDFAHNLAVVFWIMANSVWMFGEFFMKDTTRPYAIVFFVLGIITVAYHYFIAQPFWKHNQEDSAS